MSVDQQVAALSSDVRALVAALDAVCEAQLSDVPGPLALGLQFDGVRRFRLHELVERLHSGQPLDGAELALDLGYADQAHLIRDFRNLVGYTPTGYRKSVIAKPGR